MNCLWIILLLSCFGSCGYRLNSGCDNNCGNNGGRNNDRRDNDDRCCDRDVQRNRCRRAVENAVDECGSERAVMRTLKDRDCDGRSERSDRAEAREVRGERNSDNNRCDGIGMNPPHWQDFPGVSRSSSHDDCDCDA